MPFCPDTAHNARKYTKIVLCASESRLSGSRSFHVRHKSLDSPAFATHVPCPPPDVDILAVIRSQQASGPAAAWTRGITQAEQGKDAACGKSGLPLNLAEVYSKLWLQFHKQGEPRPLGSDRAGGSAAHLLLSTKRWLKACTHPRVGFFYFHGRSRQDYNSPADERHAVTTA